jgi:hypothetical protein
MKLPSALPTLAGGWLKTFKIFWFALFVVAVVAGTAGNWNRYGGAWGRSQAIFGAGVLLIEESPFKVSPLNPEIAALGFVPRSTLVAIDGQQVSDVATVANAQVIADALDGPEGAVRHLTLRLPDGRLKTVAVVRDARHMAAFDQASPLSTSGRIWLNLVSRFSIAFIFLTGATLLFRRRASDPVVALLATGMLFAVGSNGAVLITPEELGNKVADLFGLAADICLLTGIAVFPNGKFEPKWSLLILLAPPAWVIAPFLADAWQLPRLQDAVDVTFLAIATGAAVRRYFLLPAGPQRQQIKWAVLGFAMFAALYLVDVALTYAAGQASDNIIRIALFVLRRLVGTAWYLALVGGLLISLLRYRLYDADAVISRSAVYGALTLALVAIFSGTEKLVELLGEQYFGQQVGPAAGAVAAGLAALFLVPMHHRLTAWAERSFQRDLVHLRTWLPERLRDIQLTAPPEALAETALKAVCSGVTSTRAAILLPEGEGWRIAAVRGATDEETAAWLAQTTRPDVPERDSLFPAVWWLADGDEPASGLLVLGPRPDGTLYGKDERETLDAIAEPLGRALAVAVSRAAREVAQDARMTEIEAGLARVLAELAPRPRRRAARA